MDLLKYSELREKFKVKNFEKKHKDVDKWLFRFSYFGNAASIFFAYFLMQPMLYKKLTMYMGEGSMSFWFSLFISIGVLSIFEILKRKLFSITSSDLVTNKNKISNGGLGFAIGSLLIIAGSYYFSISGAIKLSNSSVEINKTIVTNNQKVIDSLTLVSDNAKKTFVTDNEKLRQTNTELRTKITELGPNQRTTMTAYNNVIKDNIATIEFNNKEIANVDLALKKKVDEIKQNEVEVSAKNVEEDSSSYVVFFSISTLIELLIIVGIYYRQLFEYKTFNENEAKLEQLHRKMDRYSSLLKYAFKNGDILQDGQVPSSNKLFDIAKVKSGAGYYTQKNIDDFYAEMTHLGVFKIVSKKRYAAISYEEALKSLDKLHDD